MQGWDQRKCHDASSWNAIVLRRWRRGRSSGCGISEEKQVEDGVWSSKEPSVALALSGAGSSVSVEVLR